MKECLKDSAICGPMVAVATPFKEDFSLNLRALTCNIRFMIDRGVRNGKGTLLVGGAGGEHPAMTVEERMLVMKVAVEAANGEVPVLSSIQHTDTRKIVHLAEHASKIGLCGVQLGPTYYYEPSEGDVLRLFQLVDSESDVNLMIYHTWRDGFTMTLSLIRELADLSSVNVLKWSAPNTQLYREGFVTFSDYLSVIDNGGEHVWSHALGAAGFITHLSGFWPEYTSEIWDLLQRRRYDDAIDRLSDFKWKWNKWRRKVEKFTGGEGPYIKAAMEMVGLEAGPPRLPSVGVPQPLLKELGDLFQDSGVPILDGAPSQ